MKRRFTYGTGEVDRMRTFAEKLKASQRTPHAPANLRSAAFGQSSAQSSILNLQRTVGNQAVLRMRGTADRRQIQRACACGGECSKCQAEEESASAEQPAVIHRQKADSAETSGEQRGAGAKPQDRKQLSKDLCVNQPIDSTRERCQFSDSQLNMVRILKEHALRSCSRAIAAINMPGNEDEVRKIAKDYFGINIKLNESRPKLIKSIKAVLDKLEKTAIECGTCQDAHCNGGAIAHVDEARTFLVLCPLFFNKELSKPYLTPRFLIHEAAHLAQLDKDSSIADEFYCFQGATKEEKCPVPDAIHNVDAWSHFIEELAYTI